MRTGAVTFALAGIPIDIVTMEQTIELVANMVESRHGCHQIATANLDFLSNAASDEELRENLCDCEVVLADGMPLVWACKGMGAPMPERVCGVDLVPRLAELCAARGYGIFLLGSSEASSRGAAQWITQNHPGARIVGRYCPDYGPLDAMDHEEILRQIAAARPDILLVAMGNPKQEKWIAMHRRHLQVPVCIGIGGTLDLLAGKLPRAPRWMRDRGLEWLYRLKQEPRRLAGRYSRNAARLVRSIPSQVLLMRLQYGRHSPVHMHQRVLKAAAIVGVFGALTGDVVHSLKRYLNESLRAGMHVIVDLAETTFIGADALGALLRSGSIARRYRRECWLTGLKPRHRRILRASRLHAEFRTAPEVADALRQIAPGQVFHTMESERNPAASHLGDRPSSLELILEPNSGGKLSAAGAD